MLFTILFFHCLSGTTITLRSVGASGDGVTDDTFYLIKALNLAAKSNKNVSGENLKYKFSGTHSMVLKSINLSDLVIVFNDNYSHQFNINITADIVKLSNVSIDGGRGTYNKNIEPWKVFSQENNVASINPVMNPVFFFQSKSKSARFVIKQFNASNIHADACITMYSFGKVSLEKMTFNNVSNKTFHVYHSFNDGKESFGETSVNNATALNVGQLPRIITVDNKIYHINQGKYMPQGSFNFIVSHGNYNAKNMRVTNYGSTGITSDRNANFIGENLVVINTSNNGLSNNPSAAIWFEASANISVDSVQVSIMDRSNLEHSYDNAAVHLYGKNTIAKFGNVDIDSNNDLLSKGFLGEFKGKNIITIDRLDIRGKYRDKSFFSGTLNADAQYSYTVNTLKADKVFFYNAKDVTLDNLITEVNKDAEAYFYIDLLNLKNNSNYKVRRTNFDTIKLNDNVWNLLIPSTVKRILEKK